ncbi:MAG: hypothetical protein WKF55_13330 [Gemmatimonadaceae bacterium]
MHSRAIEACRAAFCSLWDETEQLTLQVTETGFVWLGQIVLEEQGRTSDSLPWLFFKDGVRELLFRREFEAEEMLRLLTLIQRARLASADDDDILTLLWEQHFTCLQYRYVDLAMEGGAPLESTRGEQFEKVVSPREIEQEAQVLASSSIARMDEYDSTLYFLDDREIDCLQGEIRRDFSSDLRTNVIASLLDTYEQEADPTVREEIAGILDGFFLLLLSLAQFRSAAYLIREAVVTGGRAHEILDAQRQRFVQLSDRLSEKEALEQLLHALEETPLRPPQNDLNELFAQLKPVALSTVLSWIGRSRNAELRALLENASSRLAASHTAELVRLISSDDDVVALEAIRRAGSLKTSAAVASGRRSGNPHLGGETAWYSKASRRGFRHRGAYKKPRSQGWNTRRKNGVFRKLRRALRRLRRSAAERHSKLQEAAWPARRRRDAGVCSDGSRQGRN